MFRLPDLWAKLQSLFRRTDAAEGSLGLRGEQLAARHLESLGMRIIERGLRYPCGELDLIAVDGDVIVFVEVKTRASGRRGSPSRAVDRKKQARMTRAALQYLKSRRLLQSRTRFDVVSIVWPADGREPEVSYLRAAFEARDFGGMYS
ncbi:MAG: YraN family protein [Pirellulales bacterium]